MLLLAAGVWAYFGGQNDKIAGGFFVLVGLVLVVLAAFYSRIDGTHSHRQAKAGPI